MRQEIARQWFDALQSGEFTQGREILETPDEKLCCLGVLSVLAVRAGVCERIETTEGVFYGTREELGEAFDGGYGVTTLSQSVCDWAGLKTSDGQFSRPVDTSIYGHGDGVYVESLVVANDDENLDFLEIADLISENAHDL